MTEKVSSKSELRKRYDDEWDMDAPVGDSERPPYVPWLEAELEKANGVISMLEHHWISPMEYYEATEELRADLNLFRDSNKLTGELYGLRDANKAYRTLKAANLKTIKALRKRVEGLEEALDAANFESLASDATAASVRLVIREALAGGEEA